MICLLIISCGDSGFREYKSLVQSELNSGKRQDSLFMGVKLGMTSKEFYMHCWDMNKKGLFTDGESNTAVQYKLPDELKAPASMNFYPEFKQDKVVKVGASFKYTGWAPWNKHLAADSLREDVLRLYKVWYPEGNPFVRIENERGIIYVKVDGNRRIIIGAFDASYVKVVYTDLLVEKDMTLN